MSKPVGLGTSSSFSNLSNPSMSSTTMKLMCLNKVGFNGERNGDGEKKLMVAVKASAAVSKRVLVVTKRKPWKLLVQMFIEKVIIDCRFFTMLAVAGSLLGSVLGFVEGSFMFVDSYLQYFHALSERSDQSHVIQLLIESIGTAMLVFGMALHVMFVGSKGKGSQLPGQTCWAFLSQGEATLPSWVGTQSVKQAKSNIGQAMMMILQVGMLEKFKSIPLVTGLDLACFAGAAFISSACIFLLSRLSTGDTTSRQVAKGYQSSLLHMLLTHKRSKTLSDQYFLIAWMWTTLPKRPKQRDHTCNNRAITNKA
ncbi:unnamed protein product [Ilex paraguariensis]|uniref:Uncharacterized protein n=1 Tax=Ilex paraguariensis TaxID=185542 RepID=A0ABC8TNV8_9AQUA